MAVTSRDALHPQLDEIIMQLQTEDMYEIDVVLSEKLMSVLCR